MSAVDRTIRDDLYLQYEFGIAYSVTGASIRLTHERLFHITENHPELAGKAYEILETVHQPEFVVTGRANELMAVRSLDRHYLVVVYREQAQDGFIITSFITSHIHYLKKRSIIWPHTS